MTGSQRSPIRPLDSATIDRIAAGEVIERPASVVKELVENALDAGARRLKIDVVEGGLVSITVEDDGHGIPLRELPLAFERHATSKIGSAADILHVGTFGFRGEALASIASVSRCRFVSRVDDDEVGGLIELDAGSMIRREPAARNRGTTIVVSDLFFNTPARRKYLGTAAAEKRAVVAQVTTLALAHPEVRWLLVTDGQTALDLRPVDSLPERARDILGAAVMEHLERFEGKEGGLAVSGLASRPTWTRGNRTQQFLYVNRRPVESAALSQAIALAYREVIPPGRHPVVILFLQIPSGEVDVNVHPAKSEVRLLLERRAFSLIRHTLQEGLGLARMAAEGVTAGPDAAPASTATGDADALAGLARAESDFLARHFGGDRTGGRERGGEGQGDLFADRRDDRGGEPLGTAAAAAFQTAPFWQLHRTYICTQIRGGLVLIDQHNSHERILYNQAQKALAARGRGVPTQQLLFPVNLDLSPPQLQAFHQHRDELAALGFTIQPFGGQSILVQGIPSHLKNWAEGQLLLDVLDDLAESAEGRDAERQDLVASYACHGAVRAGELLTVPEMQALVDQLFATDLPLSCPHGRPTLIQFTLEELERRFGRR
jgi:DNA mismatch repair protein MutL